MPSATQIILLVLHATVFVIFPNLPRCVIYAVALPLPMPSPYPLMAASYSAAGLNSNRLASRPAPKRIKLSRGISEVPDVSLGSRQNPSPQAANGNAGRIDEYRVRLVRDARGLKKLAIKSASMNDNDYDFQKDCALHLTSFSTNLLGLQGILAELGADKGLANYDRANSLETLLKDIINANKDILSAIDVLIYNIPGLGPVLGPTVYDIKCLLDELLNFSENIADAAINAIQPLLTSLIEKAVMTTCRSGVVLPLCL